ncbi:MAG: recombination protein O N-terminal domain-containing protein, partial [bacterium]|nr:recombination protein O N-terminal domain-containing protein [bacterium]
RRNKESNEYRVLSYHIYTSRSLVLSAQPLREADRIYSVLTRDFGLVKATAGGVRKEESKLRGALEPLSVSSISFVKGKEFWRITSAVFEYSVPLSLAQPLSLIEKLVAGESAHPELFDSIEEVVEFSRRHGVSTEISEIILISRALFELGYLAKGSVPEEVFGKLSPEILPFIKKDKKIIIKVINRGIEESGL